MCAFRDTAEGNPCEPNRSGLCALREFHRFNSLGTYNANEAIALNHRTAAAAGVDADIGPKKRKIVVEK